MNLIYKNINKKDLEIVDGTTNVYLVVYDNDYDYELDFNKSLSHLFLDSTFVSEDINKRYTLDYKESLDDFIVISDNIDNYILEYFPNYHNHPKEVGVLRFISTPLVSSIRLSFREKILQYKDSYYIYTYDDLTKDGKKFYKSICEIYPDYQIRILTFINNQDL